MTCQLPILAPRLLLALKRSEPILGIALIDRNVRPLKGIKISEANTIEQLYLTLLL